MSEEQSSNTDPNSARRENALVGYQMAIELWTNQGVQGWARFNGMLVVNSIIIAVIGLTITSQRQLTVLTFLLPLLGLLLCGIWFVLGRREAQYSDYYIHAARELEEKYLSDPVKVISRGGLFAEGQPVTIEISGKSKELRMSKLAQIFRAKTVANWMIAILAIIYIAAILQALL